ncbi:MAG: imidazolonepropionase [Candidatus Sericytochromatia bacterium]|nr:imidazolonepropionase [Candidatus Sericytochromatia bacterium]
MTIDLLIIHAAELVTPSADSPRPLVGEAFGHPHRIADGAVAVSGGHIVAVGPTDAVMQACPPTAETVVLEASGRLVTPGLVDSHTHAAFAGDRSRDFVARIHGARGDKQMSGGINTTVAATRAAGFDELVTLTGERLARMLAHGTTTAEVKSGYGLDLANERKILQVYAYLAAHQPLTLLPTFLGAHAVPPGFTLETQTEAVLAMLPEVAPLARFVDVFCDEGYFTLDQTRRILQAAQALGLRARIHADELGDVGAAALAAEMGALSADHLLCVSDAGMQAMAAAGVVAIILPGTPFYLNLGRVAPVGRMRELGVPIALSTDFNPGSSFSESLPLMMTLACLHNHMTPGECLTATTHNAAASLGIADQVGRLAPGMQADIVIWDAPSLDYLPSHFGVNLVETVIKSGRIVVGG